MPRLTPVDPMAATGETKELRGMAVNPAVLKAWVAGGRQ